MTIYERQTQNLMTFKMTYLKRANLDSLVQFSRKNSKLQIFDKEITVKRYIKDIKGGRQLVN